MDGSLGDSVHLPGRRSLRAVGNHVSPPESRTVGIRRGHPLRRLQDPALRDTRLSARGLRGFRSGMGLIPDASVAAGYAAYVAVAALSAPIVVLAFSQSPLTGSYGFFSLAGHVRHFEYAYGVLILAVVAALCTFCIANLRRSRLFAGPASASCQNPARAAPIRDLLLTGRSWSWVGLCFFASLSLTILAVWQSPESYGFRTSDVSSLWVPCWPYSPYGRFGEPGWGCPADSSYLMQWQVWLPQMSVLLVLASSILMAAWFTSQLRRNSGIAAPSTTMEGAPSRTRNRWPTLLPGILLAICRRGLHRRFLPGGPGRRVRGRCAPDAGLLAAQGQWVHLQWAALGGGRDMPVDACAQSGRGPQRERGHRP